VSVNAPAAGKITELLANEEDTVTVGQDLFRFAPGETDKSSAPTAASPEATPQADEKDASEPKAASPKQEPQPPAQGSSKVEVKETSKPVPASKNEGKQSASEVTPATSAAARGPSRNENRVKMSRMRLRIAERLKESQNTAAFLTTFNEIDMSSLMEMRKRYKDEVIKQHEVKLGFMSAFSRACTLALKEIPGANASIEVRVLFAAFVVSNPTEGLCDLI
jgi:2-oxoglutarate dehydrogenase E2 component (dihydrolipoamide succinyltransferase)